MLLRFLHVTSLLGDNGKVSAAALDREAFRSLRRAKKSHQYNNTLVKPIDLDIESD